MAMKQAKVEAILEYKDTLPFDDMSIQSYIERSVKFFGDVTIKVTKVELVPEQPVEGGNQNGS